MSKELQELIAKSQAGSVAAGYALAVKYRNGFDLRKNPVAAFKLFAEAAKSNHAPSCCVLGEMYENGEGTARDDAKAVELYRRASNLGHAGGRFGLSRMYEHGRGGLPLDLGEAVRLCGLAAKKGHKGALKKLAIFAFCGHFSAQLRLARIHRLGIRGVVPRNFELAADLYARAAKLTEDPVRKNRALSKTIDLLRREAESGNDSARLKLAAMFETGNGVEQNEGEALKLYREAVKTRNECLPAFKRGKLFDLGRPENRELLLNDCRAGLAPEREAAFAAFCDMLRGLSAAELNGFARCTLPVPGHADRTRAGWRSSLKTLGKTPVATVAGRAPLALAALELSRLARLASLFGEGDLARNARAAAKTRLATLLDALAARPAARGKSGKSGKRQSAPPRLLKAA